MKTVAWCCIFLGALIVQAGDWTGVVSMGLAVVALLLMRQESRER